MNTRTKFLVASPEAEHFLSMAMLPNSTTALLGKYDHLADEVKTRVQASHVGLNAAVAKVVALTGDMTRTEAQRHQAARVLATKTAEDMASTRDYLRRNAETVNRKVSETIEGAWNGKVNPQVHSEIRTYLREVSTRPDGLTQIQRLVDTQQEVAATVWYSPSFLMGVPDESMTGLRARALEHHWPAQFAKVSEANEWGEIAGKFDATIPKLHRTFFNPTVADQAATRVEVPEASGAPNWAGRAP